MAHDWGQEKFQLVLFFIFFFSFNKYFPAHFLAFWIRWPPRTTCPSYCHTVFSKSGGTWHVTSEMMVQHFAINETFFLPNNYSPPTIDYRTNDNNSLQCLAFSAGWILHVITFSRPWKQWEYSRQSGSVRDLNALIGTRCALSLLHCVGMYLQGQLSLS